MSLIMSGISSMRNGASVNTPQIGISLSLLLRCILRRKKGVGQAATDGQCPKLLVPLRVPKLQDF